MNKELGTLIKAVIDGLTRKKPSKVPLPERVLKRTARTAKKEIVKSLVEALVGPRD